MPKRLARFGFFEKLAATYSRGIYKTTTIGKTVFDGRVRNGIGSDHSFMATKNHLSGYRVTKRPDGRIILPPCTQNHLTTSRHQRAHSLQIAHRGHR